MPLEGQQLGHYRLIRLLGSGGMGEVYLAEDARIAHQVAIKVIRSEGIESPESDSGKDAARLFEREAKAIARLDHPNILPLYAYGEETINDMVLTYLVMPYRKEGTLITWLRQRSNAVSLSPAEVALLMRQAADALQHAHDQQVIHQDIKPTNFLIRIRKGQPNRPDLLLADFGIAKLTNATASASQSIRGTPTYMAPEQWDGHPVPATDQYALAIMVYELLVGHPPFTGGPGQVMRQHYFTQPVAPSKLNPRLSPAIDGVLLRALAKRPNQRFATVTDFARAFQQAVAVPASRQLKVEPTVLPSAHNSWIQSPPVEKDRIPAAHSDTPSFRESLVPAPPSGGGALKPTIFPASAPLPPTEAAILTRQTRPPTELGHPSTSFVVRPDTLAAAKPVKRSASWRIVLVGLAVLVVVALTSGIVWLLLPHPGSITEFVIPTSQTSPNGIAAGPDGNLWFTEIDGNQIGRISPNGNIIEFPIPTVTSDPQDIAAGPSGNVWFTEAGGNKIGRITPSGKITEFPISTSSGLPYGITAGPDGNLWFTELDSNRISRISPNGKITEFPIPTSHSYPSLITAGPDGNLWFTELDSNRISRISPNGKITEFPIPTFGSFPYGITAGPDGNLWFTETRGNKIGRITPSGNITEFPIPTANSNPQEIAAGPDGNLWFTEFDSNQIGRISISGSITEFLIPTPQSGLIGITAGPDGNLWFTEHDGNQIGRITSGK